jgi:DnaJ-related protein SCJ1
VKIVKQQIFPGMFAQSQVTCNECGGRGTTIKKQCPHCQAQKVIDHTAHYTLEIVPGMPEEHEVVFEGEGDESPDWEPGDVILRVRSKKENGGWRRKESSLYWKETIGIDEVGTVCIIILSCIMAYDLLDHQALLGFDRNLTHLDGHVVRLVRQGVTQPGMSFYIYIFGNPKLMPLSRLCPDDQR